MQITIKAARVNAKMNQTEVANILKINSSTLSNWENGKSIPDVLQLKKLCHIYGVSIDDIFLERKQLKVDN